MAEMKLKLNRSGMRSLLRGSEMQKECLAQAKALQSRCGEGYAVDSYKGTNRVNAMLWPQSAAARQDNSRNNTLEKALGGHR